MCGELCKFPFIALEGIDGAGKSTIRNLVRDAFERDGKPCSMVGQHSWLNVGAARVIAAVREQRAKYSPEIISEAYFQDKRMHASETILPALSKTIVISDRYIFSDAVYQEVLYGIDAEFTLDRHFGSGTLMPTAILFVDAPIELAYARVTSRSKQTRHYERPAELTEIRRVYERVLQNCELSYGIKLTTFTNDMPGLTARIINEVMPSLYAQCGLIHIKEGIEVVS